ncbi:hypothetical protein BY458DRAFT_566057 [Sporodiniella umbellata]|nr:hypothetical protein BY458DRAFT_566057 [Sporodiniella umbellata]
MRGEYMTILDGEETSGWWMGANEKGHSGTFPSSFVQIIEQPPQRPTRTRPPTVKSEEPLGTAPPPVPVGTRPSSLLTSRPTSPPARPLTSPPRPLSVSTQHRRTPSIPITSPDLPPLSPVHTTRPVIPRPTSSIDAAMNTMAKPPKINLTPKLPSTVPSGRKSSQKYTSPSTHLALAVAPPRPVSVQESHPPLPKRSMPQLPKEEVEKMIQKELEKLRQEFESRLEQERKRLEALIYSQLK